MRSHDEISRFYGLPITPRMLEASDEHLTGPYDGDLVNAHLSANYSYFGAIDKTLAGFFVLDDEGDNYTLLDVRGDGRVWWQEHETRELYDRFDSLEDWVSFKKELDDGADEDELRDAYPTGRPAPRNPPGVPTTDTLAGRYQWLVWLLTQPLLDGEGKEIHSDEDLARNAARHLRAVWPTDEAARTALRAELPHLAADAHLAVYWLLHTSLLALDEQRALVLAAIGPEGERPPLVEAFAAVFGALPLDGDLPVVPGFRARRSLALLAAATAPEQCARAALLSLRIAPDVQPLTKFYLVYDGLRDGMLTDAEAAAAARDMEAASGTFALGALLDQRAGSPDSAHADEFARTVVGSGENWASVLESVWIVHRLIRDVDALTSVARFLLEKEPHHRYVLALVARAQELAGRELFLPAEELRHALTFAEASAPVVAELRSAREDCADVISRISDPELIRVVARRVLYRSGVDEYSAGVSAWAIRTVLQSADADAAELVARGFEALETSVQTEVLGEVADGITSADHPLTAVLLRIVERTPDPDGADYLAATAVEGMKEEILKALAPIAHQPPVFDRLMRLAEAEPPAPAGTVDSLWNQLFSSYHAETFILPRLTGAQAERAARAMVAIRLTHPSIRARNAAGHRLYSFDHAGAEDYLLEALDEYGRRYAASTVKGGKVFDHGETEDDLLEDVVANLYSAVRNVGTPRSRTALIERLFIERRAFWRMGDAIGEIFTEEVHRETLAALRARPDGHAAGCYAYALAHFVKQGSPKVELLRELVDWPVPQEETSRRFFAYALVIGIDAALATQDYELVRTAHPHLAAIAEPPLEPDDHARHRGWKNPLKCKEQAAQLEAVLSGRADAERRRLLDKGTAARAAGKPRRKISDKSLGILARVTVRCRILHDRASGEVWFLDTDGAVHVFDGYEITEPSFRTRPAGYGHMRDFLTGVTELSERALFWDRRAAHYTETVRYGDRITVRWGGNNSGSVDNLGLYFPDTETAAEAFARIGCSVEESGMSESSSWYLPGKGAVTRTYYTPSQGGGDSNYLSVFEGRADRFGPRYACEAEAIAAHQRWELEAQRDRNASLSRLEWNGDYLRPEDMTVRQWIRDRIRDDSRDAAWHARALTEITEYLSAHGYGDLIAGAGFEVEVGSGVSDEEIAAFEADRRHPVPEALRSFWREVGHARWSVAGVVGRTGMRVLSPAQVTARRPAARELGETYLRALYPARAEAVRPLMESLDVLVDTFGGEGEGDGGPVAVTLLADQDHEDERVFSQAYEDPEDLCWESSLPWTPATGFLDTFADLVETAAPVVAEVYHGQRFNPDAERRRFELRREGRPARFWEVFHDPAHAVVSTREGKTGAVGAVKARRYADPARAARKAAKLIAARTKSGYREVMTDAARPDAL
ncbi:WGR domain-containing protein [Streptomyces collinus]|uniref:WGR domain-containing protein n=1 Tax=Streptomyces collinus TaxID=42684 RepID=UPI0034046647